MENDIPKIDLPDNWVIGKLTQNDISLLSLYANYPCRLKAGIFAFCRKGDIEASLNLTRYRVKANTLITIQPGTILQIHKVEGDVEIYFMGFSSDFINRTDTRKPAIDIHYAVKDYPIIEIKEQTSRQWLSLARGSLPVALTGKLLPQTAVFFLVWALIDVVMYGWLRFPCHCGLPVMLGVSLLGVVAAQGMGVFMFGVLPTLRLGLSFASLWGVISFSISGMSFPVMAMHPVLQGLSYLFPLRHYFLLYVNFALNGYGAADIWPHLVGLAAFVLLPLVILRRLKRALLTAKYVP